LTNPGWSLDNAFVLKDGVEIYGGFAGTESDLTGRDLTLTENETILSGDLTAEGFAADSAWHVVIAADVSSSTVLDGVTVTGGRADGTSSIPVNGVSIARTGGGGIIIAGTSCAPVLTNVTISGNMATYGGGIYNAGSSAPALTDVLIKDNEAITSGGGIYNRDDSAPVLTNVLIKDNTANSQGGGIYCMNNSAPELTNVLIAGNTVTASYGGGIFFNAAALTLTNVTISGNEANRGGGIHISGSPTLTITTTIIWGNTASLNANINGTLSGNDNSLVQGVVASGTNLDGTDASLPVFADAAAGDYTLAAGSPAINAGDNGGFTPTDVDLAGNLRIIAATVDLGAFEYNVKASGSGTVYVKDGGTGTGDGSSWANAYPNLAFPLLAAVDNNNDNVIDNDISEIWVAGGTYYPLYGAGDGATDRDRAFVLVEGVKIYGGFAGTEASPAARTLADTTFLSGDIGTVDVNTDNAYHVVIAAGLTDETVLDGVAVTGGNADASGDITVNSVANIDQNRGSGIHIVNSSAYLTLANVTVKDNDASSFGGGIYIKNSSSKILGVTLSGNKASDGGGILTDGASPVLINVLIADNEATTNGGGINTVGGDPVLVNVTIAGNTANSSGGGIHNGNATSVTVQNTVIWGNSSGVVDAGTSVTYFNSLVEGETATDLDASGSGGGTGNLDGDDLTMDVFDVSGYSLLRCSEAVNAGDNDLFTTAVTAAGVAGYNKDQAGEARFIAGSIDMGALEAQNSLSITVNLSNITYGDMKWIFLTGDAPWDITYTVDGRQKTVTVQDTDAPAGAYVFRPDTVGAYVITGIEDAGAAGCNTLSQNMSFQVEKFNFTIFPWAYNNKTYGGDDPYLYIGSYSSPLPFGDWVDGELAREKGENAGQYNILRGTVVIRNYADEDVSGNYNIYISPMKFTINPASPGAIKKENGFEWPETPIFGPLQLPSVTVKGVPIVYTLIPSGAATLVDYLLIPLGGEIRLTATTTDPNYVPLNETHVILVSSPSQPPVRREVHLPAVPGVVTSLPAGLHQVISGTDFVFILSPAEGREFEAAPVVRASRPNDPDIIMLDAAVTPNSDGTYTVTVPGVLQNMDILIEAPVTPATGNAAITGDRVWSAGGRLYIQAAVPGEAQIYGLTGTLVKAISCTAGETVTELPAGTYFIKANGKAQKVVVNR
jgi:hypothetical protein